MVAVVNTTVFLQFCVCAALLELLPEPLWSLHHKLAFLERGDRHRLLHMTP